MRNYLSKYFRERTKLFQTLTELILVGVVLIFLTLLVYFFWALDRGFDINDESFYLLLAIYSSKVKLFVSAQHWITSLLWSFTGSIATFRLVGLCILIFSATVLSFGAISTFSFFAITKLNRLDKIFILSCAITGGLLYGATINFSPCYNLLASSGSYLAIGLAFFSIGGVSNWRNNILHFLAGCSIGIVTISKASAALTVLCLTASIITIFHISILQKIMGLTLIILGFASTLLILALPYLSASNVLEEFNLGLIVFKQVQTESSIDRILRYTGEFFKQQFWSGMFLVIPIVFLSKYTKFQYKFYYILGSILCIVLLSIANLPSSFRANIWSGMTFFLTSILAINLIFTISVWTKSWKAFIITAVLFVFPYAVSFGTGNGINTQIADSLASWSILISILVVSANFDVQKKFFSYFFCGIFIFTIMVQVIYKSFKPYHMVNPIWNQNIPVKIGRIGSVKVDRPTNDFILTLESISRNCKISNNCTYLGLYGMPGIALIIGGIPYFSPWLTNSEQAEKILSITKPDIIKDMVLGISVNHDGTHSKLPMQLSDFPNGYTNCGEVTYPWQKKTLQIWQVDKLIRK